MVHFLAEKIAVSLFDKNDKYPVEIYIYGIELMVSSLIGTLLILAVGALSGYLFESIIFMVSLSAIRFFSGGYHAKSYFRCNTVYIISYVLTILFYRFVLLNMGNGVYALSGVILLISVVILILFAPVENENKKIDDSKKIKFKVISISMVVFEMVIALFLFYFFDFRQVLAVLPTVAVVDIAILVEISLCKRRNKK